MKVLVTGGGGFLGGAIVDRLLARGDAVRSFARGAYPALAARGVEVLQGDLADAEAVVAACEGVEAVIHAGALASMWAPYGAFYAANVLGTRHVIAGCLAHGVRRLVYTSSPSVVFDGSDMPALDESAPYPERHRGHYAATKAQAEREVLDANGPLLATVALRPHLIWGPGDNQLAPRLVARARAGRLTRIGPNTKLVDGTYIDNASAAHLLALDALAAGSGAAAAGRPYFIAQGEPLPTWDMVGHVLAAAGAPPLTREIPVGLAMAAATVLEGLHGALKLPGEPMLTRWTVGELTTTHWFDLAAARRDLGYRPGVSLAEGLERLAASYREAAH